MTNKTLPPLSLWTSLVMDHEPLIALLSTPHPSGKLARWGLILQDVDLVIWYNSGKKNAGADSLSRLPVDQDDNGDSPCQRSRMITMT